MAVTMLTWLSPVVGVALIVAALVDVFTTVLHTQIESPISNGMTRLFWRLLLWITRDVNATTRSAVLAWGAPMMIVGVIIFWANLLIIGFGLVFVPLIHNQQFFVSNDPRGGTALEDAVYQSAVSFLTIGYGDVVAISAFPRALEIIEAALGLLTISMAVTYLLSVYQLIPRKLALAVALNQETAGRADGIAIVVRYVIPGRFETMGERLRTLNEEMLFLAQAHAFFPVLYYVRPRSVHESFARMLVIMQGMVATLRFCLDAEQYHEITHDPRLLNLEEGFIYTLNLLATSSHLAPARVKIDDAAILAEREITLGVLRRLGCAVPTDEPNATERYLHFRHATDAFVTAYVENLAFGNAVRDTYNLLGRNDAVSSCQSVRHP